ncbi:MAG: sensor histidine kinase [Usitatibacter sp.]
MTPPQAFAAISLVLISAIVVATSFTQASFFRQELIDRESAVLHDVVGAVLLEHQEERKISLADLESYRDAAAQSRFDLAFRALKNLSGMQRIKVFDKDHTIIWSDEPRLVGERITHHAQNLDLGFKGEVHAELNSADLKYDPLESLPQQPFIEFYVPFSLADPVGKARPVSGVIAMYRSLGDLNETIRDGLFLLWLVTGSGGLILYFALQRLFNAVYYRQRAAETRSAELERLMRLEKLSALGQLVSEIAHQLNNPLVGVVNLAELAERETDNPERLKELLRDVRKAGYHCRDFVQRMLLLNKAASSEPQVTEMNGLVRETIAFFQQSLGGRPAVTLNAPEQPVMIEVDPVMVRHAVFNLIHNAAQADPDGLVVVSLAVRDRSGVQGCEVTVSDSGPGLTPEVRAKLFTPFFTTRPGGTGLGLTVTQQVVVRHGGSISAENRFEGGACFSIWLPAHR